MSKVERGLMREPGLRGLAVMLAAIALLAALTAAFGVFARGDGATATATSIRAETFDYVTSGVYAFNPRRVVAEGVGWDVVTLLFAAPALLAASLGVARGSLKARLFSVGILAYLFYQYLMYAVFWAFGPLFVGFIALYAASAAAIVWTVATIDVATLPERFSDKFPGKTMAVVSTLIALMLVAMWGQRIATAYRGDFAGAGFLGMPTLTVQAMDLGMVVPLALLMAVLAWQRRPWGFLLAPVLAVKGVTMAAAICAMLVSAALVEGSLEVGPFAIFSAATVAFGVLAWRILACVNPAENPASVPAEYAAHIRSTAATEV